MRTAKCNIFTDLDFVRTESVWFSIYFMTAKFVTVYINTNEMYKIIPDSELLNSTRKSATYAIEVSTIKTVADKIRR